jgi:CubicO group peptidase (beta-lactamase class C family)
MRKIVTIALAFLLQTGPLLAAELDAAGFDTARLTRLDTFLDSAVAEGRMPGFAVMLNRHGRTVLLKTYGKKNLATGEPLAADTIFRIASMSKLVTGVALMILFEENKWRLEDPVAKFIPEFAHLKVQTGVDAQGKPVLVDPDHAPTMRELMSHSAGFSYALPRDVTDRPDPYQATGLHEFAARIAQAPLLDQPGTTWRYSAGADISGYIVEKLSGMRFGDFLQSRLFGPLGMKDTAFYIPPAKRARLAPVYSYDAKTGKFAESTGANSIGLPITPPEAPPKFDSGGAGLISSLVDYGRFAQMLGNKGELDGVRILSPATVELIGTNVLPQKALEAGIERPPVRFDKAIGFGLDAQVMTDPRQAGSLVGKGTMSWHGAFAGWVWVDPANDIVCVGMAQRAGVAPDYVFDDIEQVQTLVYQALTHPER